MRLIRNTLSALALGGTALTLGACYTDGGYSSMSFGVSSGGYYDSYPYYGYATRRDRDGDGVPNRYDFAPRNPYID